MDLGEAGLNCPQEVESHKRKVEAKTQAVWAATLYTLRGGKRPGKGDGEVITTCSFLYTPARHIHLFLHLAELASFRNPPAQWFFYSIWGVI